MDRAPSSSPAAEAAILSPEDCLKRILPILGYPVADEKLRPQHFWSDIVAPCSVKENNSSKTSGKRASRTRPVSSVSTQEMVGGILGAVGNTLSTAVAVDLAKLNFLEYYDLVQKKTLRRCRKLLERHKTLLAHQSKEGIQVIDVRMMQLDLLAVLKWSMRRFVVRWWAMLHLTTVPRRRLSEHRPSGRSQTSCTRQKPQLVRRKGKANVGNMLSLTAAHKAVSTEVYCFHKWATESCDTTQVSRSHPAPAQLQAKRDRAAHRAEHHPLNTIAQAMSLADEMWRETCLERLSRDSNESSRVLKDLLRAVCTPAMIPTPLAQNADLATLRLLESAWARRQATAISVDEVSQINTPVTSMLSSLFQFHCASADLRVRAMALVATSLASGASRDTRNAKLRGQSNINRNLTMAEMQARHQAAASQPKQQQSFTYSDRHEGNIILLFETAVWFRYLFCVWAFTLQCDWLATEQLKVDQQQKLPQPCGYTLWMRLIPLASWTAQQADGSLELPGRNQLTAMSTIDNTITNAMHRYAAFRDVETRMMSSGMLRAAGRKFLRISLRT